MLIITCNVIITFFMCRSMIRGSNKELANTKRTNKFLYKTIINFAKRIEVLENKIYIDEEKKNTLQ